MWPTFSGLAQLHMGMKHVVRNDVANIHKVRRLGGNLVDSRTNITRQKSCLSKNVLALVEQEKRYMA